MKNETIATGGVLGASLLIASCCLGPAVFLLFGVSIGALGTLSALEPARPIFIAVGGVLLAYAGLRIYRTAPETAEDACTDEVCAPGSPARRTSRRLFGAALVVYVLSIVYPFVLGAIT